jgi:hypothetical protein
MEKQKRWNTLPPQFKTWHDLVKEIRLSKPNWMEEETLTFGVFVKQPNNTHVMAEHCFSSTVLKAKLYEELLEVMPVFTNDEIYVLKKGARHMVGGVLEDTEKKIMKLYYISEMYHE